MRISDWSSDVCSSDLLLREFIGFGRFRTRQALLDELSQQRLIEVSHAGSTPDNGVRDGPHVFMGDPDHHRDVDVRMLHERAFRSEEHTSELQSLMRISYAVFCLTKKIQNMTSSITRIRSTI